MKSPLIDRMAEVVGSKKKAEEAYRAMLVEIAETLADGKDVTLHGVGKFCLITRAARKWRNPQTGDAMDIPAKKTVKFRPFQKLRKAVAEGDESRRSMECAGVA